MEKYLYEVQPSRVVVIPDILPFRHPQSLELTLDQVLAALPSAVVYRRFGVGNIQMVVPSNAERLHNAKFMTEAEYEEFKYQNKAGKAGTVIEDEKKEEPTPEPEPVVEPTPVEEKVEEPVVEEPAVEEAPEEEPVEAPVEESTEEETETTEESEEVEAEEAPSEEKVQVNVGGGKKKRK